MSLQQLELHLNLKFLPKADLPITYKDIIGSFRVMSYVMSIQWCLGKK